MTSPWIGRTVGNYVVRSQIGEGGMGVVLAAEHRFLGEEVAIKVLRAPFAADETVSARFFREATATRAIDHPNIVKILDFGVDEATKELYLVMELLKGQSLGSRLRDGQPLDEAFAAQIAMEVADGIEAAHQRGIVHRDLKPANIFLCNDGRVKVVDFGVAKAQDASQTAAGVMLGTPKFMAPEQARNVKDIRPAADIYSLGVVLFKMVTGKVPFDGEAITVIAHHCFTPPPLPSSIARVSPAMEELILHCMAKQPAQRPRSMAVVRDRLLALAAESTPEALRATLGDDSAAIDLPMPQPMPQLDANDPTSVTPMPVLAQPTIELVAPSTEATTNAGSAGEMIAPQDGPEDGSEDCAGAGPELTRGSRLVVAVAVIIAVAAAVASGLVLYGRAQGRDAPAENPVAAPVAAQPQPPVSPVADVAPADAAPPDDPPSDHPPSIKDLVRPTRKTVPATDRMVRMPLLVRIVSEPPGADVVVDSVAAGKTPASLSLSLPHEVVLTLAGHQTMRQTIRTSGVTVIKLAPVGGKPEPANLLTPKF